MPAGTLAYSSYVYNKLVSDAVNARCPGLGISGDTLSILVPFEGTQVEGEAGSTLVGLEGSED